MQDPPVIASLGERVRRAVDVAASGLALVLLLPLMSAIACVVKLSSPGPVIFSQERVGRGSRIFRLHKFRSMRVSSGGPSVTADGDARVTRAGRFLRKLKLDELPQFWNVLVGDMSIVGPRPEVPRYVELYTARQRKVLSIRPGITGPTQLRYRCEEDLLSRQADVESYYTQVLMPAKLESDLEYVERRAWRSDIAIVLATAGAVFRRS
jgi:lipopolysaccharide/colanic/teichoic acid biosynthesis glycosyltransferase